MTASIISGNREISVADILERALRAAAGLETLGLQPGDAIATFMRNDFACFEAAAAAAALGLHCVPINFHYGLEEAGYILKDCSAKALIIHADLLPRVEPGIPKETKVFVVHTPPEIMEAYGLTPEQGGVSRRRTAWSDWLSTFEPIEPRNVPSPGAMIYTSGTTGRPKGVRRTPAGPEQMEALYGTVAMAFGLKPGIRTIIPAPMYHSAPNTFAALAVTLGAERIVLMPRFEPEEFLRLIERHKITHIQTVPTMFVRLLKLPERVRARYDTSSLEFVVHAAAPCSPIVKEQMIDWWGPIINEYYGATEVGSVVFCTAEEWMSHKGTVGKPMQGVELRILDENGNDVPVGEPGEVYCRLMGGTDFTYHGDDDKRRRSEMHGLISVGDIGYQDEEGFLYLCDRRNDMVISGGVNIYPAEIENCLINHPLIADCAVFGIPDDEFGEALCAFIQPAIGADLTDVDVRDYVREHLASYKTPKVIEFRADLPREDSGKIFKRKLREPYWENKDTRI